MSEEKKRCPWCSSDVLLIKYHDSEWGIPQHSDMVFFEHLLMESMSCGLSWLLMLRKRSVFSRCFDGFDYNRIARYDESDVKRIMDDPDMIHSEPKIRAVINNASRFLEIISEFGSFDKYIWSFTNGKTLLYESFPAKRITRSAFSDAVSSDLKKRGFKFVGTVCIYSFLEACGLINDHMPECCRRAETLKMNDCLHVKDENEPLPTFPVRVQRRKKSLGTPGIKQQNSVSASAPKRRRALSAEKTDCVRGRSQ
ncbi:MAG: DNA-3-methyladenine glycosylase I [Pyramidobacter sp.]